MNSATLAMGLAVILIVGFLQRGAEGSALQASPETPPKDPAVSDDEAVALVKSAAHALGGVEALTRAANMKAVYQARALPEQPGLTVAFEWTLIKRDDGAIRIEKRVMNEREVFSTDGKEAWWLPAGSDEAEAAPALLRQVLELEELQQSILLNYRERGYVVRAARADAAIPAGMKKVTFLRSEYAARPENERPGDQFEFYLDQKSSLPVRSTLLMPDPASGGAFRMTTHYFDYEPVDGVPMARRLMIYRGEKLLHEAKVSSIEIGKRQPDALFKKPVTKS